MPATASGHGWRKGKRAQRLECVECGYVATGRVIEKDYTLPWPAYPELHKGHCRGHHRRPVKPIFDEGERNV